MGSSTHRRRASGKTKVIGGLVAAAVAGGGAFALTGTAQAASVGAAYTKTSSWTGGYTGQYVITNDTGKTLTDWTLEFDLPPTPRSPPCGTVTRPSRGSTSR